MSRKAGRSGVKLKGRKRCKRNPSENVKIPQWDLGTLPTRCGSKKKTTSFNATDSSQHLVPLVISDLLAYSSGETLSMYVFNGVSGRDESDSEFDTSGGRICPVHRSQFMSRVWFTAAVSRDADCWDLLSQYWPRHPESGFNGSACLVKGHELSANKPI